MRILHIIASCDREHGGPIEGVFRLGEAFRRAGHEQELLTLDPPSEPSILNSPSTVHAFGAEVRKSGGSIDRLRRWARYSPDALNWLREHVTNYDGIIVDGLWNYATHIARRVLPNSGVPYAVFPHGMLDPWFREKYPLKHVSKQLLWRFNEGPLLANATATTFTTTQERDLARQTWSPWCSDDEIVGYGTSWPPEFSVEMEQAFRSVVPDLNGRPYILFMSRLHEKKGADVLIRAFGKAAEALSCDLVMAGPGEPSYLQYLRNEARLYAPEGSVHFTGMLSGKAKWGALHGSDAMALISHQENFGVIVAESLACEKPVIISDQVNIFDQVLSADAGMICRDTDSSAEDALLEFAAVSPERRRAMGENGKGLFARKFDIKRTAERLITILEGVKN